MKTLMVLPAPGRKKKRHPVRRLVGLALLVPVLYVGFFAGMALRRHYPLVASTARGTSLRGAFHVHSTRSDGRGTPEEIAAAARAAGLQFVILTDHNIEALDPPRYIDGVLMIPAVELSTKAGHVVAVGTSRGLTQAERDGDVFVKVTELGGHAFLAHPEQKKRPWSDWAAASKAAGLELYSADSMFRTAQRSPVTLFAPAAAAWLTHPTHGLLTIVQDQPELRARLMTLSSERPYVALCAHDAHGLPSYESEFKTLAMYLPPSSSAALPSDPAIAARQVIDEVAAGRAWCAFHAIAAGDGFAIEGMSSPRDRSTRPGDALKVTLPASAPAAVEVRVTGPATLQPDGRTVHVNGTGAVQIEVWAQVPGMYFQDGWKPWLVASPIRSLGAPPPTPPAVAARAGAPVADGGTPLGAADGGTPTAGAQNRAPEARR